MKKKVTIMLVFCLSLIILGFESYYPYGYEPIFMQRSQMEKNVKVGTARDMENPGKIYIKDNYIFINEKYRGIHIIDNTNPEMPENIAFIQIDGCIDMAMKNNILYADNAIDLIAIGIADDFSAVEVKSRTRNIFPEPIAPDGRMLNSKERQARPKDAILVRWQKR